MATITMKIGGTEKTFAGISKIAVPKSSGGLAVYAETETPETLSAPTIRLIAPDNMHPNGTILRWDAVDGATGYKIYSNGSLAQTTTYTTYDMSAANIPGTYSIYVKAYNAASESDASNTVSFVVSESGYTATIDYDLSYGGEALVSVNGGGYVDIVEYSDSGSAAAASFSLNNVQTIRFKASTGTPNPAVILSIDGGPLTNWETSGANGNVVTEETIVMTLTEDTTFQIRSHK